MTELEALRRVAEAARKWRNAQHATEQYETFRALCAALDALAAVDDSPAPAAEPEGTPVAIWVTPRGDIAMFVAGSERDRIAAYGWTRLGITRLALVPEVVGEVG